MWDIIYYFFAVTRLHTNPPKVTPPATREPSVCWAQNCRNSNLMHGSHTRLVEQAICCLLFQKIKCCSPWKYFVSWNMESNSLNSCCSEVMTSFDLKNVQALCSYPLSQNQFLWTCWIHFYGCLVINLIQTFFVCS